MKGISRIQTNSSQEDVSIEIDKRFAKKGVSRKHVNLHEQSPMHHEINSTMLVNHQNKNQYNNYMQEEIYPQHFV